MDKEQLVSVTILVPLKNINIIDQHVIFEAGTRHSPQVLDPNYSHIEIDDVDYNIEDFDDTLIDELILSEWED